MVVTIEKLKVAYFPVPKAANTSMKHLLHGIKTGKRFTTTTDQATGAVRHIHREYRTPKFSSIKSEDYRGFFKIAIVRDPVERVVSAWRNRVMHHKELEDGSTAEKIHRVGLPQKPTLPQFVECLEEYRAVNKSIAVHTAPLVDFLGPSRNYYDLIFDISESRQIEVFFSTLTGEDRKLPVKQVGGPPANRDQLPDELVQKLEGIYKDDYRLFGDVFGRQTDLQLIAKRAKRHKASLNGFLARLRSRLLK